MKVSFGLLATLWTVSAVTVSQDNVAMESEQSFQRAAYPGGMEVNPRKDVALVGRNREGRLQESMENWRPMEQASQSYQGEPNRYMEVMHPDMSAYHHQNTMNYMHQTQDAPKSQYQTYEGSNYSEQKAQMEPSMKYQQQQQQLERQSQYQQQQERQRESLNALGHGGYRDEQLSSQNNFQKFEENRDDTMSGFSSFVEHDDENEEDADMKAALEEGAMSDIKKIRPKSGVTFRLYHDEEERREQPEPTERTYDEEMQQERHMNRAPLPMGSPIPQKQPDSGMMQAIRFASQEDRERATSKLRTSPASAPRSELQGQETRTGLRTTSSPIESWVNSGWKPSQSQAPLAQTTRRPERDEAGGQRQEQQPTSQSVSYFEHNSVHHQSTPPPAREQMNHHFAPPRQPTTPVDLNTNGVNHYSSTVNHYPAQVSHPTVNQHPGQASHPSMNHHPTQYSHASVNQQSVPMNHRPAPMKNQPHQVNHFSSASINHHTTPIPTQPAHFNQNWMGDLKTTPAYQESQFRTNKPNFPDTAQSFKSTIHFTEASNAPAMAEQYFNNLHQSPVKQEVNTGFNHPGNVEGHMSQTQSQRGPIQFHPNTEEPPKGPKNVKKFVHSMFKNFIKGKDEPKPTLDSLPRPSALVGERPSFHIETPVMTEEEFRARFGHLQTVKGDFPFPSKPAPLKTPFLHDLNLNHSFPESSSNFWPGSLQQQKSVPDLELELKGIIGKLSNLLPSESSQHNIIHDSRKGKTLFGDFLNQNPAESQFNSVKAPRQEPEFEARIKQIIGSLEGMLGGKPNPSADLKTLFAESTHFGNTGHSFSQIERPLNWAEGKVLIPNPQPASVKPFPTELFTQSPIFDTNFLNIQKFPKKFETGLQKNVILNHHAAPLGPNSKFDVKLVPSFAQKRGDNTSLVLERERGDVQLKPALERGFRPMLNEPTQSSTNIILTGLKNNERNVPIGASLQVDKLKKREDKNVRDHK